jgi:hypothetical protein
MDTLKFVLIEDTTEIKNILTILESQSDIQISFISLESFNNNFPRFSDILYEYAHQIKSLYCPVIGNVFEDSVTILSTLEDILEIPINHIVVESKLYDDIKQLVDFYHDDLQDGSLNISIYCSAWNESNDELHGPIDCIAYIERNKLQGVYVSLDTDDFNGMHMSAAFKYTDIIYVKGKDYYTEPYTKGYIEYRFNKWLVETFV